MGKNIFNKIPDAEKTIKKELLSSFFFKWYSQGDLNPCRIRERDVS